MKKIILLLAFLLVGTVEAQYYYIMYVSVEPEDVAEFERKEIDYWSEVAKSRIKKGDQNFWALMRKVGTAGNNSVNYAFVNGFPSIAKMANPSWDASSLGNVHPSDAASPYEIYELHNYKILNSLNGDGKFYIFNYARPKNLNGFISENQNIWMPYHKRNIAKGNTGMTDWGMGYRLYPVGQNESTIMTWDGFASLEDAMEALDVSDWTPPKGSKMDEYDPEGFRLRVIWEQVKAVQ